MSSDDHSPQAPPELAEPGLEAAGPHPSVGALARFLMRFYGRIEVVGLERVPRDRPLVFVANHVNSLVDGALLLAYMPVLPRFLGTSELWQMTILKPFLRWAAAIPVYRRHVAGFDRQKNLDTFARCHEVLAAGGSIGILPEGTSHNEPALVPLRTGVSRIVLQAEAKYGGLGVRIVPVGFTFEDRTRFRSEVLVEVGEAIDPAAEIEIYESRTREAVRGLTARIREAMVSLTLNFPSWEEADLIRGAAEVYERRQLGAPAAESLHRRVALRRTFIDAYRSLKAEHPEEVEAVIAAVRRYAQALRRLRLRDELVAARYRPREVIRFTLKSLWLLLIRLPLGLVGLVIHFLPFQATALAARTLPRTDDLRATYKIFGSMVFHSLTWLLVVAAAGWLWGWGAALAALVLVPVCGAVALRLYLRGALFWDRARAFLLLRGGRRRVAELLRQRSEAVAAIESLVELYQPPAG